jgi:DNA-binding NarL/FixJ family response regulator
LPLAAEPFQRAVRTAATDVPVTKRELAILELIAQGMTNRDIARSLSFAEVTIRNHVRSILSKLKASNRTQAAVIALRLGLIP